MSTEAHSRTAPSAAPKGPDRAWWGSVGLAAVGLATSAYLTWLKLAGAYGSCIGVGDCELVNQSRYSELFGVPVALLGALSYVVLMALLFSGRRVGGEWPLLATFGLTTFGTIFSGYLTYVELAILRAVCPYCVVSAVAMTGLWLVTIYRLRSSEFLVGG